MAHEQNAELNFVMQQGFREASPGACGLQYGALMWQPRVIGVLVAVGIISSNNLILIFGGANRRA